MTRRASLGEAGERRRRLAYGQVARSHRPLRRRVLLWLWISLVVHAGVDDQRGPGLPPERRSTTVRIMEVNRILGHKNRVAMTNRPDHSPNDDSNEVIYSFFEHFLKPPHQ